MEQREPEELKSSYAQLYFSTKHNTVHPHLSKHCGTKGSSDTPKVWINKTMCFQWRVYNFLLNAQQILMNLIKSDQIVVWVIRAVR